MELPNRLADLRPLMKKVVAPEAETMLLRHWNSQGRAFGHPWAPWSEYTLARRTKKGNAAKGILRDTDHLFKTLFRARSADSRLQVVPGGIRLSLNTGVHYAIFHQVGTEYMPDRQVIPDPIPPSFVRRFRAIVKEFILTGRVQ